MKDIKFLTKKPIAHRGLHDDGIAENSLVAFSRAIDAGYPIELDVQLTSDNRLVVFHDWTLNRMTGYKGNVSKTRYEDIKKLTLNTSKQRILLLEEVLTLVNGVVPIIIEIKSKSYFNYNICKDVFAGVEKYDGEYAISSFNPFVVKWFTNNANKIVRGQNFTNFENRHYIAAVCKKIFFYIAWVISDSKPDFFGCPANTIPDFWPMKIAKKRQKPVLVWEIEDKKEYNRIKDVIDNEFFDGESYIK